MTKVLDYQIECVAPLTGNSEKIELNQIKGLRLRQETEAETEAAAQ